MQIPNTQSPPPLYPVIESLKPALKRAALFGVVINLISLAPTLYMLEVYDRVVNSRSHMTLLMLTLLVLGLYLLMEALEWVRAQILQGASIQLEMQLGARVFDAVFQANQRRMQGASQGLFDLKTLREFITSPPVTALMDAPMAAFYLLLIFVISPALGAFSLVAAIIQVYIAYMTEKTTQKPLMMANQTAIAAQNYVQSTLRNAQVIESMGMLSDIHRRWMQKQSQMLMLQAIASDSAGGKNVASKVVQNVLTSGLLGLSCWLILNGLMDGSGAMMIIPGMLGAKALAPLVQLVATWKQVVNARDAYGRLDRLLRAIPEPEESMALPPPTGQLRVENVVAAAPGSQLPILKGVNFELPAGKTLVIVGPSAAGKSTLARLMVGIWPAANGKVRLDGMDVFRWNKSELGPHVGYLPQGIELFEGTLAENIARFGEVDMVKVEDAARRVGLHETIMALPDGYDANVGDDGCFLSGGQRQRVGLARAVYGNPRFIVLDEPNSSLDESGEQALLSTLQHLKALGTTLIVITHRTSILPVADAMLILRDGTVAAYGPRDEVLNALRQAQQGAANPAISTAPASPPLAVRPA